MELPLEMGIFRLMPIFTVHAPKWGMGHRSVGDSFIAVDNSEAINQSLTGVCKGASEFRIRPISIFLNLLMTIIF
jgi:hypothetical protein